MSLFCLEDIRRSGSVSLNRIYGFTGVCSPSLLIGICGSGSGSGSESGWSVAGGVGNRLSFGGPGRTVMKSYMILGSSEIAA